MALKFCRNTLIQDSYCLHNHSKKWAVKFFLYLDVAKYAIDSLSLSFQIENKFNFMECFQGNNILNMINPGFKWIQFGAGGDQAVILHSAWNCYSCSILFVITLTFLERLPFTDIPLTFWGCTISVSWHFSLRSKAIWGPHCQNSCIDNNIMQVLAAVRLSSIHYIYANEPRKTEITTYFAWSRHQEIKCVLFTFFLN